MIGSRMAVTDHRRIGVARALLGLAVLLAAVSLIATPRSAEPPQLRPPPRRVRGGALPTPGPPTFLAPGLLPAATRLSPPDAECLKPDRRGLPDARIAHLDHVLGLHNRLASRCEKPWQSQGRLQLPRNEPQEGRRARRSVRLRNLCIILGCRDLARPGAVTDHVGQWLLAGNPPDDRRIVDRSSPRLSLAIQDVFGGSNAPAVRVSVYPLPFAPRCVVSRPGRLVVLPVSISSPEHALYGKPLTHGFLSALSLAALLDGSPPELEAARMFNGGASPTGSRAGEAPSMRPVEERHWDDPVVVALVTPGGDAAARRHSSCHVRRWSAVWDNATDASELRGVAGGGYPSYVVMGGTDGQCREGNSTTASHEHGDEDDRARRLFTRVLSWLIEPWLRERRNHTERRAGSAPANQSLVPFRHESGTEAAASSMESAVGVVWLQNDVAPDGWKRMLADIEADAAAEDECGAEGGVVPGTPPLFEPRFGPAACFAEALVGNHDWVGNVRLLEQGSSRLDVANSPAEPSVVMWQSARGIAAGRAGRVGVPVAAAEMAAVHGWRRTLQHAGLLRAAASPQCDGRRPHPPVASSSHIDETTRLAVFIAAAFPCRPPRNPRNVVNALLAPVEDPTREGRVCLFPAAAGTEASVDRLPVSLMALRRALSAECDHHGAADDNSHWARGNVTAEADEAWIQLSWLPATGRSAPTPSALSETQRVVQRSHAVISAAEHDHSSCNGREDPLFLRGATPSAEVEPMSTMRSRPPPRSRATWSPTFAP